jgi:uncharacterized protein YndB with AHSA1/START domain
VRGREHDPHPPTDERARSKVYKALLDPNAIAKWNVPDGMSAHVHALDGEAAGCRGSS